MRRKNRISTRRQTQPASSALHRKVRMKKLGKISAGLFLILLLFSGVGEILVNKIIFYGHIARLYMLEPDSKLDLPVKDVLKKQIANTWHAPRGSDRVHEGQD